MAVLGPRRGELLDHMAFLDERFSDMAFVERKPFHTIGALTEGLYDLPTAQMTAEHLSKLMLLYLGMPMTTPKINIRSIKAGEQFDAAGTFQGNIGRCEITLNKASFYKTVQIEAVLAHECTHYFMAFHQIALPNTRDNELLTDCAAVYLGFGPYLRAGYQTIDRGDNIIHRIGYITVPEIEMLEKWRAKAATQREQSQEEKPKGGLRSWFKR